MKKVLMVISMLFVLGCSEDVVKVPDNGDKIDANTLRISLLESSQAVQDARLDALELQGTNTESNILELFNEINSLYSTIGDLSELNEYLYYLEEEFNEECEEEGCEEGEVNASVADILVFLLDGLMYLDYEIYSLMYQLEDLDDDLSDLEDDVEDIEDDVEDIQSILAELSSSSNCELSFDSELKRGGRVKVTIYAQCGELPRVKIGKKVVTLGGPQ